MINRIVLFALIGSLTLVFAGLSSCYYDNAEDLLGTTTCDTVNISLSEDVMPILSASCLVCHGNTSAASLGAGIDLEDFSDLEPYATGGALVGVVDHLPGWSPMPKAQPQLQSCDRAIIRNWVEQGAQNN